MELLNQYYSTIYAQVFSPCGKYVAAGNNKGKIYLFNLSPFVNNDDDLQLEESHTHQIYSFQAHNSPVYSMTSNEEFFICGSIGEISAWSWKDVKKKEAKMLWSIQISQGDSFTKPEVNALAIGKKNEKSILYAGCGDNQVYSWDIETRDEISKFVGHDDYIHCICLSSNNQECISGSEDGTVRIWDARKKGEAIQKIEPYKQEILHRPRFGKWIGCVAVDLNDDWLVCGGGPTLCLWHLRSLNAAVPLVTDGATTVAFFHEESVISGGMAPLVYHWNYAGEIKAEVPTSATNIYSIAVSGKTQPKILSIGGISHKLDICTNFMYRDFSLICS